MTKEILEQVLGSPSVLFFLVAAIAFVSAVLIWRESRPRLSGRVEGSVELKSVPKESAREKEPPKRGELAEVIPLKPPTKKDSALMFEIADSPVEPWGGVEQKATVDPSVALELEASKRQAEQVIKEKQELQSKLESVLAEKVDLVEKLKVMESAPKVSNVENPEDSKEKDKLRSELELLRARLKEYEIIEDDIADLAMYKEEVLALREEVSKLKEDGGSPAAAVAAAPHAAAPDAAAAAAPPPQQPASEGGIPTPVDDDIMAEFSKALEEQKAQKSAPPEPKVEPKEEPKEEPKSDLEEGLDVDKMMEEASQLDKLEVADVDSGELDRGLDSEKLLEEANTLNAGEGA